MLDTIRNFLKDKEDVLETIKRVVMDRWDKIDILVYCLAMAYNLTPGLYDPD